MEMAALRRGSLMIESGIWLFTKRLGLGLVVVDGGGPTSTSTSALQFRRRSPIWRNMGLGFWSRNRSRSRPVKFSAALRRKVLSNLLDDDGGESVLVFVANGRFHLEAFMIANPGVKAFRYDPYMGKLFLEEYDHVGMKQSRKDAILKAKEAQNWGVVLGTLGRQGNPKILERLEKNMRDKGFDYTIVLMSEISPGRISLFEDSVDAWIQIACPRLSIDWGDAFVKPVLTPFEAEISLRCIPGWWEKPEVPKQQGCDDGVGCKKSDCSCGDARRVTVVARRDDVVLRAVNSPTCHIHRHVSLDECQVGMESEMWNPKD